MDAARTARIDTGPGVRMTTPADPPGLRLEPLRRWLVGLGTEPDGFDATGPITAHLFPGGRSNVTYRLEDARGASLVLRRPPLGHVLPSAHDTSREYRVLSGLGRTGFPVPRTHALCEDTAVIGAPFVLMSYVDGRVIADAEAAALLAPSEADAISAALVSTLVRLHDVDVTAAGLSDLGRPQGYLPRQLDRWSGQWELTRTRDLPEMDELRDALVALIAAVPKDLPWSLVHGDYRLDNSVLARDSAEVLAVLDWEMSTLGDPVSDLALALLYWTRPEDGLRRRVSVSTGVTDQPGFWSRDRMIEAYAAGAHRDLDHLDACTALACFKLAVITESIHARTLRGHQLGTASEAREGMGVATECLAELGLNVVRLGTVAGLAS
jgi:aminoglycoside phosphotransferase (APT) family kinase protein